MTDLLTLKRSREGYRTNAKKIVSFVTKTYSERQTAPVDTDQLTIYKNNLDRYQAKLEELNASILSLIAPEEVSDESDKTLELEDAIWTCLSQIEVLRSYTAGGGADTSARSTVAMQVNLPKLELPKFNGDALHWQEFWDSFESTIHKSEMSSIDKFKYLKNVLTGDAAKFVDGFRLVDVNYDTVIAALKERFGNPEVSIFAHFEHLLALPTTGRDLGDLQGAYDQCEKHIRSLVALGLEEDTFGRVFIPIILSKLPRHIRVELHRRNGSQLWSLKNLRQFFKDELTVQQMGNLTLHDSTQPPSQSSQRQQNYFRKPNAGQRRSIPPTNTFVQSNKQMNKVACIFCKGTHFSDQCLRIADVQRRRQIAQSNGHCFKCLSTKHRISQCPKNSKCYYCSGTNHHSAFCLKRSKPKSESTMCVPDQAAAQRETQPQLATKDAKGATAFSAVSNGLVYMQMANIEYPGASGTNINVRVYLDPGSSCSYITEEAAKRLRLRSFGRATVANARFEDRTRSTKSYKCVHLPIPTRSGDNLGIEAFVTDHISVPLEKLPLSSEKYPILSNLTLADTLTTQTETVNIDILIGGDYYYTILTGETIKLTDGLVLLGSSLGYITAGMVVNHSRSSPIRTTNSMLIFSSNERKLRNIDVERFWSLDDIGIKDNPYQLDDDYAIDQFNKSIREVDGRYEVGWPWRECTPQLPTNRYLALKRLRSLLFKIKSQPDILQTYDTTIQTQLAAGTIELVDELQASGKCDNRVHYLPHHCIVKTDKSTTKLRIVYDASCKADSTSPSLNDCLLRGPVFLNDLCGLLLKFRTHRIALVSDIEKAFLQVGLRTEDRDVTRFFWLKNPHTFQFNTNLLVYRFTKVPFGIVSSPFLLEATIRHHLQHTSSKIAHRIVQHTYVDNVIYGVDNEQEAEDFYVEAKRLFGQIKMNLREWFSNYAGLTTTIADADRGNGNKTDVLGLQWNFAEDTLSIKSAAVRNFPTPKTKRQLLQVASSLFDPCGLYSPLTVRAKILMQQLWKLELRWDGLLTDQLQAEWKSIAEDYFLCASDAIPRVVCSGSRGKELHCFCDASMKAYGAAVYIRSSATNTNLILAKSRVSPIKPITLPRLELLAVVVGSRLASFVKHHLDHLNLGNVFIWTDSKCVLHWICSRKVSSVFVTNRVSEIKKHPYNYLYVPTADNPADFLTKGTSHNVLRKSGLWWHGPLFLKLQQDQWPAQHMEAEASAHAVSAKHESSLMNTKLDEGLYTIQADRFSSFRKLLATTAYVRRFIFFLRSKSGRRKPESKAVGTEMLDLSEVSEARHLWLTHLQTLIDRTDTNTFKRFSPFIDSKGLWRCGGRLENSSLPDSTKHPVILPTTHPVVDLIIHKGHADCGHGGRNSTMASVRSEYWIPKLRSRVNRVLNKCQICRIWEGKAFRSPEQAPLPEIRLQQGRPFQSTGIDYLGPLVVSDNNACTKIWICLLTCASTRAIHLEMVNDMTCDEFLLCLRRFIAVQGKPDNIVSDNAKCFKLANSVLQKLWNAAVQHEKTREFLLAQEIRWIFIPEYAPWMGGFYERLVGLVKRCLKKILGGQRLSSVQLRTVIYEVSSILNNRPLLMSDDTNDIILTPSMLLGRRQHASFPVNADEDSNYDESTPGLKERLIQRWNRLNEVLKQFWDIWLKQYITSLREVHQRFLREYGHLSLTPQVGSVVLIGEKMPRSQWKLARIIELHQSHDGRIRSARLQLSNKSVIVRPLKLLYPVEIETANQPAKSIVSENFDLTLNQTRKTQFDDTEPRTPADRQIDVAIVDKTHPNQMSKNDNICRSRTCGKGATANISNSNQSINMAQRPKSQRKAASKASSIIRSQALEVSQSSESE